MSNEMTAQALMPGPKRFSISISDGEMAGWRWVNETAPPLLFCHATGFCASVYKQMLQGLSRDYDVFALDMRGHGKTTLPTDASRLRSWDIYARDIAGFLDLQGRQGWTLAGHSMGGVTALTAARGRSDINQLKLIEPVIVPGFISLAARTPLWQLANRRSPMVQGAKKRRSAWPTRKNVIESYGRKALFARWADGVLEDYLEDGLVVAEDGGAVSLACDPAWEAATFGAMANDVWGALRAAGGKAEILAARRGSSTVMGRARDKCARLGNAVLEMAEVSHLAPMEAPEKCADFIAKSAEA